MRTRGSRNPSARPRTTRGHTVLHMHELTTACDQGGTSSSDAGEGSPVRHTQQPASVAVHYQQLPAPCPEQPVSPGLRSLTGRKLGGGGVVCRSAARPHPQPAAPPRLAIIDFNKLTRGGLDQATGRGRARNSRGRGRGKPKRRDSKKLGGSPAPN
jgi:hypothetical protein